MHFTQERFSKNVPNEFKDYLNKNIRSFRNSDYIYFDKWMKDLGKFYDGHDS
jgi:hypothetical protein